MTTLKVTDYGAAGDGSTDDTQAIRDTIADAADGDTIYFPSGTYLVGSSTDSVIPYRSSWAVDLTFAGASYSDTTLKMAAGHSSWHFFFEADGVDAGNPTFKQLAVDMNAGNNQDAGGSISFYLVSGTGTYTFRNVIVDNPLNANLKVDTAIDMDIRYSALTNAGDDSLGTVGHSLVYGPDSKATCTVQDSVFKGDNSEAIHPGQETEDVEWATVEIINCYVADCPALAKCDPENDLTVFDRVNYQAGSSAIQDSSGVRTNIDSDNCGEIRITNSQFVGPMDQPAVDIGSATDVSDDAVDAIVIDNCHFEDVDNAGKRSYGATGTGVYVELTDPHNSSVTSAVSVANVGPDNDGQAVWFEDGSGGSYSEVIRNGTNSLGKKGGVSIGTDNDGGTALAPSVPSESDVGPGTGSSGDSTNDSDSTNDFEDWTPQWASTIDDWSVVSDTRFEGDHAMQFANGDSTSARYAIAWDTVGAQSDVEVLDKFRVPSFAGGSNEGFHARCIIRGGGAAGSEDGYMVEMSPYSSDFRLLKYVNGGFDTLSSFGPTPAENTFYYRRFRANGDTLKVKIWEASNSEPSSWDVSLTDTDLGSGWIGFGSYDPQAVETDVVSVATGGTSAPGPSSTDSAPSVAWSTPTDDATVSGTVTVQIDATDSEDDSLDVQYRVDSGSWRTASFNSTSGYYEDSWDTTGAAEGSHTLGAEATDSAGNTTTASIGVTVDNAPSVATAGSKNVTDSSATLVGELEALEASDATVYFELREEGTSSWTAVGKQTLSATGQFSTDQTGLSAGTAYEFRAVAETSDTDTGSTFGVQTDSTSSSSPSIDSFQITDKSNPSWNWYEVDWTVSDPDGDLETVISQLRNDGVTVDSETSTVKGDTASFSHEIRSKGPVDEVRLLVNDQENNSTSGSKSV